jgi:probable addiction module antidote protein
VYFVRRGEMLIVLLAGGDKGSRNRDISTALVLARSLQEQTMPKTKTIPWDSADHLEMTEDIAAYLEAAFEDGDPVLINHALGVIARAKGMTEIAQHTGMGRQSLYKALSADGHPEFSTVLNVMRALGLRLTVTPA